ncbi:hypothetical protein GF376_00015 [Candidatus Peregrinibacteria bacterium]|nr:hypothetical protein [Candidatus Peregrinibacteria bacterium]
MSPFENTEEKMVTKQEIPKVQNIFSRIDLLLQTFFSCTREIGLRDEVTNFLVKPENEGLIREMADVFTIDFRLYISHGKPSPELQLHRPLELPMLRQNKRRMLTLDMIGDIRHVLSIFHRRLLINCIAEDEALVLTEPLGLNTMRGMVKVLHSAYCKHLLARFGYEHQADGIQLLKVNHLSKLPALYAMSVLGLRPLEDENKLAKLSQQEDLSQFSLLKIGDGKVPTRVCENGKLFDHNEACFPFETALAVCETRI